MHLLLRLLLLLFLPPSPHLLLLTLEDDDPPCCDDIVVSAVVSLSIKTMLASIISPTRARNHKLSLHFLVSLHTYLLHHITFLLCEVDTIECRLRKCFVCCSMKHSAWPMVMVMRSCPSCMVFVCSTSPPTDRHI